MSSVRLAPTLALLLSAAAFAQPLIWLEAESRTNGAGRVIDAATEGYGAMARADASDGRFIWFMPTERLVLPPFDVAEAGTRPLWVRAFPLPGRRVTVVVDGQEVGTTGGASQTIGLVWHRVGEVRLAAGRHTVELRAGPDNTRAAYVDVVALPSALGAILNGRSPADIVAGALVPGFTETFSGQTVGALRPSWRIQPPAGADAVVEMAPAEDDGALHVHNGSARPFELASLQILDVKPGDQLTVRVRARQGTLLESLTLQVPGVGSMSPPLYRDYRNVEQTWLVPPGTPGPILLQLIGRGGGDTWLSEVAAFRQEPPLSPFATGRFLPPPTLHREGRLFELERYVVNADAFGDADTDGDRLWTLCRLPHAANASLWFSRGTVLKSDTVAADRDAPADGCPPLHLRVGPLEPGRYQVHLGVSGRALGWSADGREWQRLPGSERPDLGFVDIRDGWFEFWLDDRYAEPGNPGPTYADFIRFMPIEDPAYTMAPAPAPSSPARGTVARRAVPLTVPNAAAHARQEEPVRFGVPVPRGELADAEHVRLLDAAGRERPACVQVTGRWPDGSVKWLLVDSTSDAPAAGAGALTLEYGHAVTRAPMPEQVTVTPGEPLTTVDTGAVRVIFSAAHGGYLAVTQAGQPVLALADAEFEAADGRRWTAAATPATLEVEEHNALRATVRVRGVLVAEGQPGPFVSDLRVHLFAGRPELAIEYGFYATAAEPTVALAQARLRWTGPWVAARFGGDEGTALSAARAPRLVQTGTETYGGAGPFRYTVRDAAGITLASGERAPGWVRLDGAAPLVAVVPHFWQQFPKALGLDGQDLVVDLWPKGEGVEPFVAHAGAGKSHRLGFSFGADAQPERWTAPLFPTASPEWYCASGAFEELVPRRPGVLPEYEAIVDVAFEGMLATRAGYGMENWGDVWQEGYVPGARTWSNQEWDLVNNWVIPFVRTGDRRFLDFAHEAARHYADVDCVHDATNPALIGAAWMHAHTSLRGHQLEPPNFLHAGWVEGMLNVYHLTGDRRGLEASRGIADYICRCAPQADQLPPEGPPYQLVNQRAAGWPLTTLCLVYRETWQPLYLQTARRILDYARRCQDPERGIWDSQTASELPYRGGCVFAFTLFRGLRLFSDLTGEARAREDYVNAARWVFGEMWRPGHRYLNEQSPEYEPGSTAPFALSELGGYAARLSGDPLCAAIAYDALLTHSARGERSGMVGSAQSSQWGNGILQQVPRMLHDREQTGLGVSPQVTLAAPRPQRVPQQRPGKVLLRLRNDGDQPLEDLSAECLVRGDWAAAVASCPTQVPAHGEAAVELTCQAPPPLEQYELQSDLAHVHVLVRYRQGGRPMAVWGWARLDITPSLDVQAPALASLQPGATEVIELRVSDAVDALPEVSATVSCDLAGVSAGAPVVTRAGDGTASVTVPLTAAAGAAVGAGRATVEVTAGPRQRAVVVPVKVVRFRAALIEDDADGEWWYPFEALRDYPGIGVDHLPASRLAALLPDTPEAIAARWDAVLVADTGRGAAAFSAEQLAALAEFVRRGGGLMTVGGAGCYTPGGFARTPLAEVLPVDLADGSYVTGESGAEVIEPPTVFFENLLLPMPRFGTHHKLAAKPGARVLARFDDGAPLVALGTAGQGRVVALGASWNHGSGFRQWPEYSRFISRLVRWVGDDLNG